MKSLRILQLGPYPPPRGGVQTNMLAIQDELEKRGYVSEIVAITRSDEIGAEPNVHHPKGALHFIRLLRKIPHDILHLHIGGSLPVRVKLMMLICSFVTSGKKIITFHSGGFARSGQGQKAKRASMLGYIFRRFDHIIVVNSLMIGMFKDFGVIGEKIDLIPPYSLKWPDPDVQIPEMFRSFIERQEDVLITVGLLETDYDLPLQINVLNKVLDSRPGTGLIIVGSGSLRQELEALIRSTSYADQIMLAGDTESEVVLRLIEKADALLRTTIFDGDAISIREALFLGTPVVATDNGMRPEGVALIPVGGAAELETAILKSLSEGRPQAGAKADGGENIAAVVDLYEHLSGS